MNEKTRCKPVREVAQRPTATLKELKLQYWQILVVYYM